MTLPMLLFMAQPPPEVRQAMQQAVAEKGWDRQLGDTLFDQDNWHQSLSHPVPSAAAPRDAMMALGAQIEATAFTMVLNRVRGASGPEKAIHWAFHAQGVPKPFTALLTAIRTGLRQHGWEDMPGHSPHVTISYWAPHKLASTKIQPIAWRVDEILLVERRKDPLYRYLTLGRWPLRPAPPGVESQLDLW